jgi:hypothetical protein
MPQDLGDKKRKLKRDIKTDINLTLIQQMDKRHLQADECS